MKPTILLIAFCVSLVAATVSRAQNRVELYADLARTQCEIADNGYAIQSIHLFLMGSEGGVDISVSAPRPACWQGATWVADQFPEARGTFGNTQTVLRTILFVPGEFECRTPPVLICSEIIVATGGSLPCCQMRAVTSAENANVHFTDCAFNELRPLVLGKGVIINANETCHCDGPLAVDSTTWGRVKSLYR